MLEEKILHDYKEAMKAKDSLKVSVLSFLRSGLINVAKDARKDKLGDVEVIAVVKKQVKQRQDSIEQFTKGQRQDLVDKESKELEILQAYLPQQLDSQRLLEIIAEVMKECGAASMKDMGRVVKEVMQRTAGTTDGKQVSELVRTKLQP